jgi:hypothetical protein
MPSAKIIYLAAIPDLLYFLPALQIQLAAAPENLLDE